MASSQRTCTRRAPTTTLAVLLLLLLSCAFHATAATVNADAWLSAPASLWDFITGGSNTGTAATNLMSAAESDFNAAVTALDSGASVSVTGMSPYTSPATGPAYGTSMTYTVSSTVLTASQIADCLHAASLPNLNSLFTSSISGAPLTVTVLNANGPTAVSEVVTNYLPLTGMSYFWELLLSTLNGVNAAAVSTLVIPLEVDLQNKIDSTQSLYLAVVPTDITKHITNASSMYLSYSVWAYPTTPTPPTAAAMQATANATTFTNLNTFMGGLASTYSAIAAVSDFIPTSVSTWVPLVLNPSASSSSGDIVVVEGNITGNYLLTFAGSAHTWGVAWSTQRLTVSASIIAAAEAALARRFFVTTVQVVSAATVPNEKQYVGGLRVTCYVSNGYSAKSNNTWGPEDLVSMLLQGDYSATQAIYVATAAVTPVRASPVRPAVMELATPTVVVPGALATTAIDYDYSAKMLPFEIGMIIMAAVIGFLVILSFIIACGCCCCCRQCVSITPKETTPGWETDIDRYQRGMMNHDRAFAQAENPREGKKDMSGVASAAPEDDASPTPNPLARSPDDKRAALQQQPPREGDAEGDKQRAASPHLQDDFAPMQKVAPPTMYTAEGVPLEAMYTPQSPARRPSYGQYLKAEPPLPPPTAAAPTAGAAAVTAPPPPQSEEDERTAGSHTRPVRRTVSFLDGKDAGRHGQSGAANQLHNTPTPPSTPPPLSPSGREAALNTNQMSPTPFFNPLPLETNRAQPEADAMNQTRLSQGSDTRLSSTPTPPTAPPPPAYPHYESRHYPSYPSPDLYAGAPSTGPTGV